MTTTTKATGNNIPNTAAWGSALKNGLNAAEKQLVNTAVNTMSELTKAATAQLEQAALKVAADALSFAAKSLEDVFSNAASGAPSAPSQADSGQPAGGLKVDSNGVITTAGGYKIEATDQFNWKITGPDGKETKIWGDPHVSESDGGEWQFKRNSTFQLPDGTRIDVTTKPYGNGATVTGQLDITSGTDRLSVTDIDKGKGKVGNITHDAATHVDDFNGDDVFVMGKESDDWTFESREIKGSENQGEDFILGNEYMAPGSSPVKAPTTPSTPTTGSTKPANSFEKLADMFKSLSKVFESISHLSEMLNQTSAQNPGIVPQGNQPAVKRRQGALEQSFAQIGRMLDTVTKFEKLARSIETNRNRFLA